MFFLNSAMGVAHKQAKHLCASTLKDKGWTYFEVNQFVLHLHYIHVIRTYCVVKVLVFSTTTPTTNSVSSVVVLNVDHLAGRRLALLSNSHSASA